MTTAVSLAQSVAPGVSLGFKNRIINGAMMIDQRNAGASVTPNNSYTLDRWSSVNTQTSKFTVQQSSVAPAGFKNSLLVTSSSAYSIGSGDAFALGQAIEGFNVADLGWGAVGAANVTVSFWVRSSLTGTFGGALQNSGNARNYPFSYTINSANTWEQKSLTIAGDTTGTWLTNNGVGIQVFFGLGCGSTFSGTSGSWASGNIISATGATSVVGTNGATFYITGVQLEVGTAATNFEFRDYGRELLMCQRYYEQGEILASIPFLTVVYNNGANPTGIWWFKVEKRASPTVTGSATSRIVYPSNIGGAGGQISSGGGTNKFCTQVGCATTISTASAGWLDNFTIYATAEL